MPNPKLPPILINKAGSVYYVYTYKNIWDRELKRSKRGESKKIGTILGGQKEGKIRFDEAFLQEHPEFRNYQVERVKIMSLHRSQRKVLPSSKLVI